MYVMNKGLKKCVNIQNQIPALELYRAVFKDAFEALTY